MTENGVYLAPFEKFNHTETIKYLEVKIIYIICNLKKLGTDAVTGVEEENERDETYRATNPQIDGSRTKDNYYIVSPSGKGNYTGVTRHYAK